MSENHDCDDHGGMFEVPGDRLREMSSQIARLTEALEKYGTHDPACNHYQAWGEDTPCDCGLTAAITEPGKP